MAKLNDKKMSEASDELKIGSKETTQEVVEEKVVKAPETRKIGQESKELIQLVVFELDKEEYAVEIGEVREILRKPEITPIPNSPDFIEGIINVRGKIVVVMDLEARFNLERASDKKNLHVVLAEIGENTFGATVDEVTEVLRIPKDSIEAAPAIISEKIHADYVKGIAVLEGRLLIMLDLAKVFDEKGLAELASVVGKQAKVAQAHRAEEKPEEKAETDAEHAAKIEKLVEERIKDKKDAPAPKKPDLPSVTEAKDATNKDEQKSSENPKKPDLPIVTEAKDATNKDELKISEDPKKPE